jgi:dephospho-CoA kinase
MLISKKVAVTGGLASGKTTVARFFKELGAFVVSADEIVHELLSKKNSLSKQIHQRVIALLGHDIEKNGNLDRQLIAEKVFNDEKLLKKLEEILHPAVLQLMEKTYEEHQNYPLFVAEVPLLFEGNYEGWFDAVVAVSAPEKTCMNRFCGTEEEYYRRMQFQMNPKEKETKAQFTMINDSDLNHLQSNVIQLFHVLTQEELHPHEPRRRTNP